MKDIFSTELKKIFEEHRIRNTRRAAVFAVCGVIAVGLACMFVKPASTQKAEAYCGIEEHVHTDECYEEVKVLVCPYFDPDDEYVFNDVDDEEGYELLRVASASDADMLYVTQLEDGQFIYMASPSEAQTVEKASPSETYDAKETLVKLVEDDEPKTASPSECDEDGMHHHTDACYKTVKVLVCDIPEHKHELQCFSNPEADLENAEIWERRFENIELTGDWSSDLLTIAQTQVGYAESTNNYKVEEDGTTMKGYTRYGEWCGDPYGDWCAMFASFCLNYAQVDSELMPQNTSCQAWVEELSADGLFHTEDYIPAPGDLVFFDNDIEGQEELLTDHVGIVKEVVTDETTGNVSIKTIEGNSDNRVNADNVYSLADGNIVGYGELPLNPERAEGTIESEPASDGAVAVITGKLPLGAKAVIEAVTLSQEELAEYVGAEQAALMESFVAYDIKIVAGGREWQPDDTVSVVVKKAELEMEEDANFGVAHIADETGEATAVPAEMDEEGEISFKTDGFSLYIFYTFTVDFHFGGLTFSMNGLESVRLSELFDILGINKSVSDVVDVVFSDSSLIEVEQTGDGDWRLISLAPFNTHETLTIYFSDGSTLVINVTDAVGDWVNPCDEYLTTSAANDWQIVAEGYEGNDSSKKDPKNQDGDNSDEIRIQKNVVPTDNENEFLVYLSVDKHASIKEILDASPFWVTTSGKYKTVGEFTEEIGSGNKSEVYEHGKGGSGDRVYYVKVEVYQTHRDTTPIYIYNDYRYGGTPNCSKGTAFIYTPAAGGYIVIQTDVNLHDVTLGQGSGKQLECKIYLDDPILPPDVQTKSIVLDNVVDIMGDYIEYAEPIYSDGTATYDSANRTINWDITPNASVKPTESYKSGRLDAWYENVAQLLYKVKLDTSKDGFKSCAGNMDSDITDPESYKVNNSAEIEYHTTNVDGEITIDDLSAKFQDPYVRGLNYDFSFMKVDADDTTKGLSGAIFRFLDADGNPMQRDGEDITFSSNADGYINVWDMPILPTYVEEIKAPAGYSLPTDPIFATSLTKLNYTIAEKSSTYFVQETADGYTDNMRTKELDGNPLKIENSPALVTITLQKVDSKDASYVLPGAEFDLYEELLGEAPTSYDKKYVDAEGNTHYLSKIATTDPIVTDEDGKYVVPDLRCYTKNADKEDVYITYYLFETKAPDGYKFLGEVPIAFNLEPGTDAASSTIIIVEDDNEVATVTGEDNLTLQIKNEGGYELPSTGGIGTAIFYVLGSILLMGAGILLNKKRVCAEA